MVSSSERGTDGRKREAIGTSWIQMTLDLHLCEIVLLQRAELGVGFFETALFKGRTGGALTVMGPIVDGLGCGCSSDLLVAARRD